MKNIPDMEQSITITITGTECWEWQGWAAGAGGPAVPFQSVLELLRILNQIVEETE